MTADRPKAQFAIDEPVRLKTGGPDMLVDGVVEVRGQFRYRCCWTIGDALRVATYTAEQIEHR